MQNSEGVSQVDAVDIVVFRKKIFADPASRQKAIDLLNKGFGYDYIAQVFHCKPETIMAFKRKQKKLGVSISDFPRNGPRKSGIQPGDVKRVSFVKLFYNPDNVEKAISLINAGISYKKIGKILGCDKTSVISFHQRKINEGIVFQDYRGKIAQPLTGKRVPKIIIPPIPDEKMNPGRTYAQYLADYVKKRRILQKELMKKARKTIKDLRKKRIKDAQSVGMIDELLGID